MFNGRSVTNLPPRNIAVKSAFYGSLFGMLLFLMLMLALDKFSPGTSLAPALTFLRGDWLKMGPFGGLFIQVGLACAFSTFGAVAGAGVGSGLRSLYAADTSSDEIPMQTFREQWIQLLQQQNVNQRSAEQQRNENRPVSPVSNINPAISAPLINSQNLLLLAPRGESLEDQPDIEQGLTIIRPS